MDGLNAPSCERKTCGFESITTFANYPFFVSVLKMLYLRWNSIYSEFLRTQIPKTDYVKYGNFTVQTLIYVCVTGEEGNFTAYFNQQITRLNRPN